MDQEHPDLIHPANAEEVANTALSVGSDGPARPPRGRCGWPWAFSQMSGGARLLCLALCFAMDANRLPLRPQRFVRLPDQAAAPMARNGARR
jgi:hypothetical protein